MTSITTAQLKLLAPNSHTVYRDAFASADAILAAYDINKTALRLRHFMAQVLHETGGLTVLHESMNYSAERMMVVWPSRFPTLASAKPFAHNQEALANKVYGGRMGNVNAGDGWKYIGRGLLQITGREDYAKYGKLLGIKLESTPDLAIDSAWSLKISAEEWKAKNCNAKADEDSLIKVTVAINGGKTGLAERQEWLKKTTKVWP